MIAVLIPVKESSRAKTRLGGLLSLGEQQQLMWAMFEDVSRAVSSAHGADRVFLVSNFGPAMDHARALGWEVLVEDSQESESASVDWASKKLKEMNYQAVMRLPADVPLIQSDDIEQLLGIALSPRSAVLVPSQEGTGTNAIIRTPADLFPSRFGPNSLTLHQQEAARVGVNCRIVANPRIALDIDEPADVMALLEQGLGTASHDLLIGMGVRDRLKDLTL